ncbi:MAG: COG1615 family transporter, partial [Spirulinaceae cyanobacterium RM2_2_10]|nr:COG1615 family transporter [Spirulinaceae cyanobacterium RM2_2_10]
WALLVAEHREPIRRSRAVLLALLGVVALVYVFSLATWDGNTDFNRDNLGFAWTFLPLLLALLASGLLLSTYRQLQEIRLYYRFNDVDVDRYTLDGDYRQVMLSPRELAYGQVPERGRTWVNQRLKYTHGYGAVLSPVNRVSEQGLPELWIKDIPPVSAIDLEITQPRLYYGEETTYHVFTGTSTNEFDFPQGGDNASNRYDGAGGVAMPTLLHRLAYALDLGSFKLLISNYFTPESKILYHREIRDRIQRVVPFLRLDRDPYLCINNGRLQWIMDAYTTSDRYPYSEPFGRGQFNYIRNSVKVVVDAYDGTLQFFITDTEDPILKAYQEIFPNLFTPAADVPEVLRSHFRYPLDLFAIQAQTYLAYHMQNAEVFYNQEDLWRFPNQLYEQDEQVMEPYYVIVRLPDAESEEFVLTLPFTPVNKNNMVAWLAARSDGDRYGKKLLYEFPKQQLVYGPQQIEARIDQNPQISQQLTLWSQEGSQVIRGDLFVIPIEQSLLYVEPIYLRAEQSELPELKRVILAYGDQIVMETTLEQRSPQSSEPRPTAPARQQRRHLPQHQQPPAEQHPDATTPPSPRTPRASRSGTARGRLGGIRPFTRRAGRVAANAEWSNGRPRCVGTSLRTAGIVNHFTRPHP